MNTKVSAFQRPWKPCWQIPESILLPGIQTPPSWAPLVKSAGVAETRMHRCSNRSWGRGLASERERRSERPQDLCQGRHGCSAPHVQPLLDTRDGVVDADVGKRAALCFHRTVKVSRQESSHRSGRKNARGSGGEIPSSTHRPSSETRGERLPVSPRGSPAGV